VSTLSILVPLTNANALAMAASTIVFRGRGSHKGPCVLTGTVFIVLGEMVVANAKDRSATSQTGLNSDGLQEFEALRASAFLSRSAISA
jgi:hypothetical protein